MIKNSKLKKRMYPYIETLPLGEQALWPPANRGDVIERRVREIQDYLDRLQVLTFRLSNLPAKVKVTIEYEKENSEQPSLLFDYILGRHKAISINIKDLIPLPDLIGARIIYTMPKKYKETINGMLKELGIEGIEDDENNANVYELAGIVEFNSRSVYFIKPDFITDKVEGQKSPRRIPFRYGFVRLVLRVEHADGSVDRIKLAEAEVFWIRHSKLCSGVAFIMRRKGSKEQAAKLYKQCRQQFSEAARGRDNWALLLIHRRFRDPVTGKWREEWLYKQYNFINTNAYPLPRLIKFGNQSFEIVDFRKYKALIFKDFGKRFEWKLEPYNHRFSAWFVKSRAKKKGKGEITVKPFHVYQLTPLTDNEDWYILVPEKEIVRMIVENKHHWHEGWGRIFVELRRRAERVDALLVKHRRLYPQVIAFSR